MKRLLLIGVSHKTAPVEWRERLAVPDARLPGVFESFRASGAIAEAVVISTCNRVEVYAVADDAAAARALVTRELAAIHGDPRIAESFYSQEDAEAVAHLFRVAAGLDSLVVGEAEILGQVKRSYEAARAAGATGKLTNVVFQRALYVGKLVRSQTTISEGPTSTANLAVALAGRIFGNLHESRVLLLGAGKMAELSARALLTQKVAEITVLNRTFEKARELAERFRGRAAAFETLPDELAKADIVVCSTGSQDPIVSRERVAEVMQRRRGRSLFFIDIAVPRDVEPSVHQLENVYVYNIDDLETIVAETLVRRQSEIEKAGGLVGKKAGEFAEWYRAWRSGESATLKHAGGSDNTSLMSGSPAGDRTFFS